MVADLLVRTRAERRRRQDFGNLMGMIDEELSAFGASADDAAPRLEGLLDAAAEKAKTPEEKARVEAARQSYQAAQELKQHAGRAPPPPPEGLPH